MGTTALETSAVDTRGALVRAALIRFGVAYGLLYFLPSPLDYWLRGFDGIDEAVEWVWRPVLAWTGAHVLHLSTPVVILRSGSGDTLADWVKIFCCLVLAAIIAALWTAITRAPTSPRLSEGMRVYLRYTLATIMLGYGFAKVFPTQFPFPGPGRLMERIGDLSPMGLLWTFMGYSAPYSIFGGAAEVAGAVLLFFRRTTTLGALVLICVLSNVVMLNLAYDVPVKQFSMQLLLVAGVLAAPDAKRLLNVLVLDRPTEPASEPVALFSPRVWKWVGRVQPFFVALVIGLSGWAGYQGLHRARGDGKPAPLAGYWQVKSPTDAAVRAVLFSPWHYAKLIRAVGNPEYFSVKLDAATHRLSLVRGPEGALSNAFTYVQRKDALELDGMLEGKPVELELERVDEKKMRLVTRGFHWVQAFSYNR